MGDFPFVLLFCHVSKWLKSCLWLLLCTVQKLKGFGYVCWKASALHTCTLLSQKSASIGQDKEKLKTFLFLEAGCKKIFKTSVNHSVLQASWDTGASLFFCYFPSFFLSSSAHCGWFSSAFQPTSPAYVMLAIKVVNDHLATALRKTLDLILPLPLDFPEKKVCSFAALSKIQLLTTICVLVNKALCPRKHVLCASMWGCHMHVAVAFLPQKMMV